MSYPRPSRVFSRHAQSKVRKLRELRELISNLPAEVGASPWSRKATDSGQNFAPGGQVFFAGFELKL